MLKQKLLSGFIATCLVMQLIPVLTPFFGVRTKGEFWPFMNYCMYAVPREEGDETKRFTLLGETVAGDTIPVSAMSLGTEYGGIKRTVWHKLKDGREQSYAEQLMDRFNAGLSDPGRRIRRLIGALERRQVMPDGVSELRREVVFSYEDSRR
jgi:hypothetical protein